MPLIILAALVAVSLLSLAQQWFWENASYVLIAIMVIVLCCVHDKLSTTKLKQVVIGCLLLSFIIIDSGNSPNKYDIQTILYGEASLSRGKILLVTKPFAICERDQYKVCTIDSSIFFAGKYQKEVTSVYQFKHLFELSKEKALLSFLPWRADDVCDLVKGLDDCGENLAFKIDKF